MRISTRFAVAALATVLSVAAAPIVNAKSTPAGVDIPDPARVQKNMVDILALDKARFEAWKAGDFDKFAEAVGPDFIGIDGNGAPGAQRLEHDAFLAYAKAARPASTVTLEQTARVLGFEQDVAVVQGTLKDSAGGKGNGAGSGSGAIYSAVYARVLDDWQLVRFIISPLTPADPPPAPPPGPAWSIDEFSPTQAHIIGVMRDSFQELAVHDTAGMENTLDDTYVDIHGNGLKDYGKAAYIQARIPVPKQTPGLIGLEKPNIESFGNYGDVVVIDGIRRDATAGAIYGTDFTPPWRNVVYYMAVVRRLGHHINDWRLTLYHATYVHTPNEAKASGPAPH